MGKVALLAGTTGLIGSQVLDLLLENSDYERIIAMSRKPIGLLHPRLTNLICELDQLHEHAAEIVVDDVFCCLGTTMKKAKTKEAFRAVDFKAPLELAKISKANGAKRYLLVSALGANKNSSIFYNKVKGEVEEAIAQVGFESNHIFQPSLLTGSRQENRAGEEAAQLFYKIFGFLIPKRFASIESKKVARAMIAFAQDGKGGRFIHSSAELQAF